VEPQSRERALGMAERVEDESMRNRNSMGHRPGKTHVRSEVVDTPYSTFAMADEEEIVGVPPKTAKS
jgi:hypothetical protein